MPSILEVYSMDNPLFKTFAFYGSALGLKMLAMSALTARMRMKKKAFANPEDAVVVPQGTVKIDEDVERIRRAHRNDLENIPVFLVVGNLYLMTNPCTGVATMLFRTYTAARIMHTLVYAVFSGPHRARGLSWVVGYGITIYMAVSVLKTFVGGM